MIKLVWSHMGTVYEQIYLCPDAAKGVVHALNEMGIKYEIKEVDSKSDRHAKESMEHTA